MGNGGVKATYVVCPWRIPSLLRIGFVAAHAAPVLVPYIIYTWVSRSCG